MNKPFPQEIQVLDRTQPEAAGDILTPFAIDELACREVGRGKMPVLHLWTHRRALVAGIRDGKLPNAPTVMRELREQGWETGIRHSGGAAVPLDQGVLNISLIVPKAPGDMDFRQDFTLMVRLLERCVETFGMSIHQGEVAGSYCPGDYDLSIGGRKFCGIAQRRQTRAIAIQAFVVVEGSGEERARTVQRFYEAAAGEGCEAYYPRVRAGTMGSLVELGISGLTVERFKLIMLEQLREEVRNVIAASETALDWALLDHTIAAIRRRYSSA